MPARRPDTAGGAAGSAGACPPPPTIGITLSRAHPSALLAQVHGELDMATAPRLYEQLVPALEQDEHSLLVVDLTHVPFLAAAGIAALLRLHALARERNVTLRVVASHRPVTRPLQLLGLTTTLDLRATRSLALSSPRSDATDEPDPA
jgi:anti-anti-sigma factor